MTLKEKIAEICPGNLGGYGGVIGCPNYYDVTCKAPICCEQAGFPDTPDECKNCWTQEWKEEYWND